jgi:hypothetical protein
MAQEKEALRTPGQVMSPKRPWGALRRAAGMDMRRPSRGDGGRGETSDERLDRLIATERRARSTPPPGEEQHELRRLKMVPEGSEGSAVSGDAAAAHGGQRGGAEGTALVDVPRPTHLPLDFGQPARDPQGLLAPLVRGAPGDGRALQADQGQVGHSGQVQHGDQGGRAQVSDGSMTRRG